MRASNLYASNTFNFFYHKITTPQIFAVSLCVDIAMGREAYCKKKNSGLVDPVKQAKKFELV